MTPSAVIVNYRSADLTLACVYSLRADGVTDIVVVDNHSGDGCGDRLGDAARWVVLPSNRGYGAAANVGVAMTSADTVLVCNPDVIVEPGTVAALAKAMEADPRLGAVGPRIDRPDGSRYPSARTFPTLIDAAGHGFVGLFGTSNRWSRRYLRTDSVRPGPVDWVSGAFMLVRRQAFEDVGGFDEGFFMFMEDVDLCWRLHRAGWGVAYEADGRVTHLEGASRASAPYRMIVAHHRSLLRYGWRTSTGWQKAMMPVVAVGLGVRTVLLSIRTYRRRPR